MDDQPQDHYAQLGVPSDATTQQIRSAARNLYFRHLLDKEGGLEVFQKVCQAMILHVLRFALNHITQIHLAEEILANENTRCGYDRARRHAAEQEELRQRRTQEQERSAREATLQRRREEAARREEQTIRRAQEANEEAARRRLQNLEEQERLRRLGVAQTQMTAEGEEQARRSERPQARGTARAQRPTATAAASDQRRPEEPASHAAPGNDQTRGKNHKSEPDALC